MAYFERHNTINKAIMTEGLGIWQRSGILMHIMLMFGW